MTCNQLVVLLASYRGSIYRDKFPATFEKDIEYLEKRKLIIFDGLEYVSTEKGNDKVKNILNILG